MFASQLANRILHLALQRGWIPAARLGEGAGEVTHDPVGLLARLREEGVLDAGQIQELERAAMGEPDPLLDGTLAGDPGEGAFSAKEREAAASGVSLADLTRPRPVLPRSGSSSSGSWPIVTGGLEGDALGPYQVLGILGSGGMGRVYKALDPALGRVVALKVLQRTGPDLLDRFLREARAQARVEHPYVAKVHAVGEAGGRAFIAMQYVEGQSLREGLAGLPLEEKVRVLEEACEGVHAAHRLGIIHRDLKPGNILVERDADGAPHPVVLDFGLASLPEYAELGHGGYAFGTPRYMSPEQVQGRSLDRRTDVYSLGVTCFEVLCGRPPFEGDEVPELLRQVVEEEAPRPSAVAPELPRDLETILLKAMEKAPARRYDSARALGADFRRYLEGEPILARPSTRLERFAKWTRRNRALAGVTLGALGAVVAVGIFALAMVARSRNQARAAAYFNRESERQESLLARTYSMPAHDVTAAEDQVRADLERLQRIMKNLGREAEGPGLVALGRAHRLLGDLEEAHGELKRAWDLGYHSPEAAVELGLAKAGLYRRLLMPRTGADRVERQQDLDARYRKPAIELLRLARLGSASTTPDLAQAELALTEERYEEALRLAQRARENQGWLYESHLLEAEVHMQKALRASDGRRHQEAEALLVLAGEALAKALEIGRSAPAVYLLEARRRTDLLRVRAESGRGGKDNRLRDWALEACEAARRIRPRGWEAATCRALAHLSWAPQLSSRGEDPRTELKLGIEAAEQALAQRPESNETLDALAFLWWRWAMVEQLEGKDPREPLRHATSALERAFKDPELAHHLHHRMGLCNTTQALYDLGHGVNPEGAVAEAERHFRESYRLKGVGQPLSDLLWALGIRAQAMAWGGADLTPLVKEAEELHAQCRKLIPGYFFAQTNLADILLLRVEAMRRRGEDPGLELQRCRDLGESALGASPNLPYAQVILGRVALLQGLREGLGTDQDFERARRYFEAARAQRPNRVEFQRWPLVLRLERLRLEPAWSERAYRSLSRDLDGVRQRHPSDPELVLLAARLEAQAARRGELSKRKPRRAKAETLRQRVLELNPNLRGVAERVDSR